MECGRLATQTEMPVHHGPWCEQGPRSFPQPNQNPNPKPNIHPNSRPNPNPKFNPNPNPKP